MTDDETGNNTLSTANGYTEVYNEDRFQNTSSSIAFNYDGHVELNQSFGITNEMTISTWVRDVAGNGMWITSERNESITNGNIWSLTSNETGQLLLEFWDTDVCPG